MNLFNLEEHTRKNGFEKYMSTFQTKPEVCRYMVSLLPPPVRTVLEPTPGTGNLVAALHNYEVTAPKDFFLLQPQRYDAIVMNPPFSSKYANMANAPGNINISGMRLGYYILSECMKRSDIIIALMPWFTILDSDTRLRTIKKFGLKSLTTLSRNAFGYARIQTLIIELDKSYKGETIFKMFNC